MTDLSAIRDRDAQTRDLTRLPRYVREAMQDRRALLAHVAGQAAEIERLQAQVDALVLEFCPESMTPKQLEEWARNQRPAAPAVVKQISAAVTTLRELGVKGRIRADLGRGALETLTGPRRQDEP